MIRNCGKSLNACWFVTVTVRGTKFMGVRSKPYSSKNTGKVRHLPLRSPREPKELIQHRHTSNSTCRTLAGCGGGAVRRGGCGGQMEVCWSVVPDPGGFASLEEAWAQGMCAKTPPICTKYTEIYAKHAEKCVENMRFSQNWAVFGNVQGIQVANHFKALWAILGP